MTNSKKTDASNITELLSDSLKPILKTFNDVELFII